MQQIEDIPSKECEVEEIQPEYTKPKQSFLSKLKKSFKLYSNEDKRATNFPQVHAKTALYFNKFLYITLRKGLGPNINTYMHICIYFCDFGKFWNHTPPVLQTYPITFVILEYFGIPTPILYHSIIRTFVIYTYFDASTPDVIKY